MSLHIRRHLHELPETYKEVFMWRVLAELSFSEIGALFGKTANWACVTYHRARKLIQKGMEVHENEK
jgi:RNA polymerase sigma-70 factor (ECF subfamily)